ncbi:MAG: hypothetical protein WC756_16435 [Taibaiella sp.]
MADVITYFNPERNKWAGHPACFIVKNTEMFFSPLTIFTNKVFQLMPVSRLFLSLLMLATISSSAEEYDKIPVQKDRIFYLLKGSVASATEQKWIPSKDSTVFSSVTDIHVDKTYFMERSEEKVFDSNGFITKLITRESDNRKKNNVTEKERLFYYKNNKLIGLSDVEENRRTDSVEFHYRKKGEMDYYRLFNNKQDVVYKVDYVYKTGRVFSIRRKNEKQFPVSTIKYKYKDDCLVETQHFNDQSSKIETRRYSVKTENDGKINDSYSVLDEKGNMKEGLSSVKDSLGKLLEQNVINSEREVTEYKSYVYDEHSNPITEKIFSSFQELTITNRYTYDETGNWIRKEIFYNGILNAVVLREIKYEG